MAPMLCSLTYEVFGKVQGVFFRKHTQSTAVSLGLVGWVKNTKHQTVVGCIQGVKINISAMKKWLETEGSPQSRIDKCEFHDEKDINELEYKDFQIIRNKKKR